MRTEAEKAAAKEKAQKKITKQKSKKSQEKGIHTNSYQAKILHKEFAQALNVVIIVKRNSEAAVTAKYVLSDCHLWGLVVTFGEGIVDSSEKSLSRLKVQLFVMIKG